MTSVNFAYWLQGFFEISDSVELNSKQVLQIKNHLNLVFKHEIDPAISTDPIVNNELQQIHDNGVKPPSFVFDQGYNDNGVTMRC